MDPTQQAHVAPTKMTGRTKLALWLLIGPTGLYVAVFTLFAVINYVFSTTTTGLGEASVIATIMNVILFLAGVVAFLTWLPGIITGIILLTTKPQPTQEKRNQ